MSRPSQLVHESHASQSSAPWLLEARGLGRRDPRRNEWLLRDVSLKIAAGQRWAITGPSGSGKTVLLRALAQLDPIQEGQILWHGRPVGDRQIPEYRARIVYLHQRPQFVEGTVEENLRLPWTLQVRRRTAGFDPQAVTPWLERVGRDRSFLAKSCDELSGGEGQIVALLRVLQLDPEILLLDEPTAALDAQAAGDLQRLVHDWLSGGGSAEAAPMRATLWVTHRTSQADEVADRHLLVRNGRVVEAGMSSAAEEKPPSDNANRRERPNGLH